MNQNEPFLELFRWDFVQIPAMLYCYASELELDAEDLGILGAVFYAFNHRSKPLFMTGVEIGQVMRVCPVISKHRLSRRLNKWEKTGLITVESSRAEFALRKIYLEPLYSRLRNIIVRDHPDFKSLSDNSRQDSLFVEYEKRIEELEFALQEEKMSKVLTTIRPGKSQDFHKVADFISQKTGNLISLKMANELRKWMNQYGFKPEFILCMLELCFEREINHPRQISKIADGLRECSINSLEAMEAYFRTFVDEKKWIEIPAFDPETVAFGNLTGIDMNAEARKKIYHKWRYDWGFSPELINKAGEIMCSRTRSGGLEYVDSILSNWKEKGLSSIADVEQEIQEFKTRRKTTGKKERVKKPVEEVREIYIPPALIEDVKSK